METQRHKLLATELDSARISRMDRIRNETIRTKAGLKKDILQEIGEQQLRWHGHVMRMEDCKIARQVAEWNPHGEQEARQISQYMGLGTVCKEETLKMNNVFIVSSGGRKLCLWVVPTEQFLYMYKMYFLKYYKYISSSKERWFAVVAG
jgi:hypothetical protein